MSRTGRSAAPNAEDEASTLSSLSAGLSAYNAAEPKPMSGPASVRSGRSGSQRSGSQAPHSVDGSSARSVASALSQGTAGRNGRFPEDALANGAYDPDQEARREEEYRRTQAEVQDTLDGDSYYDDGSRRSGDRAALKDPDEASRMSGRSAVRGCPPSPRSGASQHSQGGRSARGDPDGMSAEFGADDPDGRHYAPGVRNHSTNPGPPSVRSGSRSKYDDASYSQRSGTYYDEEPSVRDEGSYYSRASRDSSRRSVPAPPSRDGQLAAYQDDDETYGSASRASSYQSNQKARDLPVKEAANDKRAMWWYNFSRCVTLPFPDACIRKDDAEAKQAWREKVAICFCVLLASGFFVGIFGFVPVLLCRERTVYTMENVEERTNENWIAVNGIVYDVTGLFDRHPTGPQGVEAFLHDDASRMFPRTPPALLPDMCLNLAKFEDNEELQSTEPECSDFTSEDAKNGLPCHTFVTGVNATAKYMGEFEKGVLAHDGAVLLESPFTFWVSIHDRVYNVTQYVNDIRNEQTKQIEKDHPMAYLEPTLNNLVVNKLNEDATELFLSVYPDDRALGCLDELFYVGIIDTRFDVVCYVLNIVMYFLLCFVAVIMIAQMICSLMYIAKGTRTYSEEDTQDQVIVMVPCYNEGGKELIKTIDSVLGTTYPEENKVIFIIADGVVTGAGQDLSTPEHLAEILGFEMDAETDELYDYDSIGLLTSNRARVYHGYYEVEDRSLKYLVVVKHGLPMEQAGSAKPGNRGKRDSQLIIMGYFNRIYHGRELTELDAAIEDALIDLNMQSDDMRLLMTIDADTRVDEMSVTHMTYAMNQNDRILALCGETKVDNKWQSWVTMMQVFEYYNNHHMKKGFESAFGCVTCLPGCFTMYRILNDDGKPLLADDHVYAEYLRNDIDSLHEQNLFHLGEDRMLTTLLLHFFPGMQLSYVPEAQCFTIVPHSFRILLSQRRRWINSTYHNLLELTKVKTMCGVCCCSMKTVVYLDLIACMILPASTVYAVYLIFLVAAGKTQFSLLLLVLYGLIVGVQLVVFILRSRYDFLFWFAYFTIIGVPVFYFVLPLYAFWHMDDFSWGETRKVAAMSHNFRNPQKQLEDGSVSTDSDEDDGSEEEYSRRD